ncbi:MAG: hypothetical protein LPK18_10405 [Pseudomonadaceae bacterium]|nr:hypothetical protein [Pseudomonadaceae bacterium]
MSAELIFALGLGLVLLLLGQLLTRQAARMHRATLEQLHGQCLQRSLELLRALQKHRGLGAQQDLVAVSQRNALARQLDQLWLNWPGESLALPPLHCEWPLLRMKPADFDGHSRVIESLLGVIETLAERLAITGIGATCRHLEDLARLRGLAVRAANYGQCPPVLQQQMRELCTRIAARETDEQLHGLLAQLRSELIEARQPRLAPADCFALLTPPIERLLHSTQLGSA